MSTRRQQLNQAGWFYHTAARTKNTEPAPAPPPSQIPGLSALPDLDDSDLPKPRVCRGGDSKYIQLARQGGHPDLLQNKYADRGRSKEPVNYPRVDWFYLQDNEAAAKEEGNTHNPNYQFMLPDYMVHDQLTDPNNAPNNAAPKRSLFGYDSTQVYDRDSDPTRKDVKLPETKMPGYGVRCEKLKNKSIPHNQPPPPKPIRQEDQTNGPRFGNAADTKGDLFGTEYQKVFTKQAPKAGRRATPQGTPNREAASSSQNGDQKTTQDKELFKLSRFKNVPARTESHRQTNEATAS